MSQPLPPLMFEPKFVEKIWGGRRLETSLGKKLPADKQVGESWEIYDFPPGAADASGGSHGEWTSAVVAGGEHKGKTLHQLMQSHGEALLGEKRAVETKDGRQFPLLIKFLDARDDLSIQVHPTPEYAAKNPGAHLKTECWIVLDHTPGAQLYKGLKPGVTREKFERDLKEGHVTDLVGLVPAKTGDCHFLPSGAVHALGAGVLVAEVQTPSDTTYRVFDFNRVEASTGKPRKLHVKEALEVINFDDPGTPAVTTMKRAEIPLVDCEFFKTVTLSARAHQVRALPKGQMMIWMITEGSVKVRWGGGSMVAKKGQTVLFPAILPPNVTAQFGVNTTLLETTLP